MGKKIGIAALVLVLALGGAAALLWHRLTALPDWYGSPDMIAEDGTPRVDDDWVRIPDAERPKPRLGSRSKQQAGEGDAYKLRNPHLRKRKRTPVDKAIKASKAVSVDGEIEAGAVVNLAEADVDKMKPKEREEFEKVLEAFPALTGRDVYVGIEGVGRDADGAIALGPETRLRVGDTRYTLKTVAKRIGRSEAELRQQIEGELAKLKIEPPPA